MKRSVLCCLLLASLVGSAFANGWLKYTSVDNGKNAKIKGTIGGNNYGGSSGTSVFAGQIKVKYGATQNGTFSSEFATYCISPDRNLLGVPAQNPWDILTPQHYVAMVGDNSTYGRLARLVSYGAAAAGGDTDMFDLTGGAGQAGDVRAAIFQCVLWSIVSDGPDSGKSFYAGISGANGTSDLRSHGNWTSGATDTYENIFREYWNAALNLSLTGQMYVYTPNPGGTYANNQQILVGEAFSGSPFTPTPEPFTMSLGLAAAAAFVRRRIKA